MIFQAFAAAMGGIFDDLGQLFSTPEGDNVMLRYYSPISWQHPGKLGFSKEALAGLEQWRGSAMTTSSAVA